MNSTNNTQGIKDNTAPKKGTKLQVNTFNHLLRGLHEASAQKQMEFKHIRTSQKMTNKEVIAKVDSCERAFMDFKLTADKLTADYEKDVRDALKKDVVDKVKEDPSGQIIIEIFQAFLRKRAEFGESIYDTAADALVAQIGLYKEKAKEYFPKGDSDDKGTTEEVIETK